MLGGSIGCVAGVERTRNPGRSTRAVAGLTGVSGVPLTPATRRAMLVTRRCRADRIPREDPLFDRLALDEVFLHELGNALGGHAVVPGSFGIDDHGRAVAADAQAADFAAIAGIFAGGEVSVFDLALEHFPCGLAFFGRAARRAGAEKDVPAIGADAYLGCCGA